jgi:alpha-tubulin suppressor-like RCC1 family protein
LAGILACGNVEWTKEEETGGIATCRKKKALEMAAGRLGLVAEELEEVLAGGAVGSAQSRTDALAQALYAGVFSWLVQRANGLMNPITDENWIGVLDLPGFGSLKTNSLDQLVFNYAEECLHQLFLEKTIRAEREALTNEGISLTQIPFTDNAPLVNLLTGTRQEPGVFTLLSQQCGSETGTDEDFLSACSEAFESSGLLTLNARKGSPKGFTVRHTLGTVSYSTTGFRERSRTSLEEPIRELLRNSSNGLVCELATAMDDGELFTEQSSQELSNVLSLVGGDAVDLHFVKCLLPNRVDKSCKEDGCFDWQCVYSQCKGHCLFEIVDLQCQSVQYTYRGRLSEFLTQFGALVLASWSTVRQNRRAAVEALLRKEVPESLQKKQAVVSDDIVLMSQECVEILTERRKQEEQKYSSVAELVQQAARGYAAGAQLAVSRERLVKLQACVRRRMVLQKDLSKQTTKKQFYGIVRLLQSVDLLKRQREAAITIEAHMRTALARQQYQERVQEFREASLLSHISGAWNTFTARRLLQDLATNSRDAAILSGILEAAQTRLLFTNALISDKAVSLQSFRRGVQGKREVEGMREDQVAFGTLQSAMETVLCRKALTGTLTEQSMMTLQSQRRGLLGRREVQEKREDLAASCALGSALATASARSQLVKAVTDKATLVFQKDRRGVGAKRQVDDVRNDKEAKAVFLGVCASLQLRARVLALSTDRSAVQLQSVRRGAVARTRVEALKVDKQSWGQTKAAIQTFLVRKKITESRSTRAAVMLQSAARTYLAKKRINHMRFIRLQRALSGVYHRKQARDLVLSLQADAWLKLNCRRLCSALEAVAWRRQHVQHIEHQSVRRIQRCVRGMISRRRVQHLQVVAAQALLMRVWRCYQARALFLRETRNKGSDGISSTILSKLQTLHVRAQFNRYQKFLQGTATIQRVIRGWLSRKMFKDIAWQQRATRAKRQMHSVLRRFHAIAYVYDEEDDALLDKMNTIYHCMITTLRVRAKFQDHCKTMYYSAAASRIQKVYRGWSARRKPGVRMIKQAIDRVQLENRDRSTQQGHAAASLIQAVWRSWIARQVLLLPKVISHLALERTSIFDARLQEVSALKNFRSTLANKVTDISVGACAIINMAVNYYGDLRARQFRNWGEAVVAIEHRGDSVLDMAHGKQHALASCVSGQLYAFHSPDHFTDEDAEPQEEDFNLSPLSFREALRDPMPRITKVCCGERHTLLLSDQGLLFTWGMNNRGQCGVGRHLPEECYFNVTCLQKWALKPVIGIQPTEPERSTLPRIKTIACGANHSGCVDAEGILWLWGDRQGVGLFNLRSMRGNFGMKQSFLLFKMTQEAGQRGDTKRCQNAARGFTPPTSEKESWRKQWVEKQRKAWGTKDWNAGVDAQREDVSLSDPYANELSGLEMTAKVIKSMKFGDETMGSSTLMFEEARAVAMIKEEIGDILNPTRCCNIVLCDIAEGARLRIAGTPVLDCYVSELCAPVYPAPARGVAFIDVVIGPGVNSALSDKGYLYTWGLPEKGQLGRQAFPRDRPAAPQSIPFFPQLAIALSEISVGREHVIALTTHGRVFTWGKADACLGPSGFQRCTLEEPMFVEGLLREVRVVKVAAGRLESAVATEGFDTVLGWEMLEMSAVGHRMHPVAYQYTFTGPRSGYNAAGFDRLSMAHSDAVQFLYVGGPTSVRPHLHGLEPYPEDITKALGHHFTRKNEGAKKRQDIQPRQTRRGANGRATTELFQWAARSTKNRRPTITDPQLKRAAASMVSTSFGARKRDVLEVDRDLSGFRRLALSRAHNAIMEVDSDCYKEHDYDAHEETEELPPAKGTASDVSELSGSRAGTASYNPNPRRSSVGSGMSGFKLP